ncbi:uncharacterized protein METZ01_LOCUS453829, partial [marine metagenome]
HRILKDGVQAEVKVGDSLTREQILNTFTSRHFFFDANGSHPVAGIPTPQGMQPIQSTPWALADIGTNPTAQRSLVEVDQTLGVLGYRGDAFDIMLDNGTPEVRISRVVDILGQDIGAGSEGAIVPALSKEDTLTLVTAAAQVGGATPFNFDADNPPEFLGAALGALAIQDPDPHLPSFSGTDVNGIDLINPDLSDDEVDSLIREEIGTFIDVSLEGAVDSMGEQGGTRFISSYLENVGMSAFHWDELDEDETNA